MPGRADISTNYAANSNDALGSTGNPSAGRDKAAFGALEHNS